MMTKDEAKELTEERLTEILGFRPDMSDSIDIIEQNWPQISKQLDKWFTIGPPVTRIHWTEAKEILEDTITWMLRAFVASKEG